MTLVLRRRMLVLQPLPSPHGGLSCYSRRALSSRTRRGRSGSVLAPRACLPVQPVHWRNPAQPPTEFPVPAGGLFSTIKTTYSIHVSRIKYGQIQTCMHWMQKACECIQDQKYISACIQDQNTERYIQVCTEYRGHICMYSEQKYRQKRRYELMNICMYLRVCELNVSNIHASVHWTQHLWACDTCRYKQIHWQADKGECAFANNQCMSDMNLAVSCGYQCAYLYVCLPIQHGYISSYQCCMYFWQICNVYTTFPQNDHFFPNTTTRKKNLENNPKTQYPKP